MITIHKETFIINSVPSRIYDILKWQVDYSKRTILGNKYASKKPFYGEISKSHIRITRNKNKYSPLPDLLLIGNISQLEEGKCKVFVKYKLDLLTIIVSATFISLIIAGYLSIPSNSNFEYSLYIQLCISILLVLLTTILLCIVEKNIIKTQILNILKLTEQDNAQSTDP
ncbi:MAG: hypothetical protein U0W24_06890 [Bacteroidales bacterium]